MTSSNSLPQKSFLFLNNKQTFESSLIRRQSPPSRLTAPPCVFHTLPPPPTAATTSDRWVAPFGSRRILSTVDGIKPPLPAAEIMPLRFRRSRRLWRRSAGDLDLSHSSRATKGGRRGWWSSPATHLETGLLAVPTRSRSLLR